MYPEVPLRWNFLLEYENIRSNYRTMTNRCFLRCPLWEQAVHRFPNHIKHRKKFETWVVSVGGKLGTDKEYNYYKSKRLCHIHFEPIYCYSDRRISPLAVPTLYLTKQSRDEYWEKDLELRRSMLKQSKLSKDDILNGDIPVHETLKDKITEEETTKDKYSRNNILKDEIPIDYISKYEIETIENNEDLMIDISEEKILSNNIQSLRSETQESLVALLIANILEGEDDNYANDVQEQPTIEFKDPKPVTAVEPPKPVAEILIKYEPTSEVSNPKLLIRHIPTYIKGEVVKNLKTKPVSVQGTKDLKEAPSSVQSCYKPGKKKHKGTKDLKAAPSSVQSCYKPGKKKHKGKSDVKPDPEPMKSTQRIVIEHNYSRSSKTTLTSQATSKMQPKETIKKLKNQVKELRKQLKFYKKKYEDLFLENQQVAIKKIRTKNITKMSSKSSRKKRYKHITTYFNRKKVGCNISLPLNI